MSPGSSSLVTILLIGPGEQEVANTLDNLLRCTNQKGRKEDHEYSWAFHLGEVSGCIMIWNVMERLAEWKVVATSYTAWQISSGFKGNISVLLQPIY